jgi:hypothetical protein
VKVNAYYDKLFLPTYEPFRNPGGLEGSSCEIAHERTFLVSEN